MTLEPIDMRLVRALAGLRQAAGELLNSDPDLISKRCLDRLEDAVNAADAVLLCADGGERQE